MTKITPQTITCKAAVVSRSGDVPKVVEIQVEPPRCSEVRITMLYASLCHTDVLCSNGFPSPLFPRVLGHEGVGVVESVGESVTSLKEGDIVMPLYLGECGECPNCKSGKSNICHKYPIDFSGLMSDGTSRMSMSINGSQQPIYHVFSCSTWSEYTVVDSNYVMKIDPRLPLPHASFLCCGFTTGFGAAWKELALDNSSASVAVIGLGAVRLGVVEGARAQGASKIIGVDINDMKRAKGEAFGMTDFIYPINNSDNKSISQLIKDATGGLGVDYCFECSGVSSLLDEALEATKVGLGTVVMIGQGTKTSGEINFMPLFVGRTLKGCIFGGVKIHSDLPLIVDKCINKEIKLEELSTHEVAFDDVTKAFEYMKQPDCVKVIIKF